MSVLLTLALVVTLRAWRRAEQRADVWYDAYLEERYSSMRVRRD